MITQDKLSNEWLVRQCDPGTYARGHGYRNERRARLEQVQQRPGGGVLLLGTCQGSGVEPYDQHVEIHEEWGSPVLDGDCSCPVGYNCKHVVAQVLTWMTQPEHVSHERDTAAWLAELMRREEPAAAGSLLYILSPGGPQGDVYRVDFVVAKRRQDGAWGKGRVAYLSSISYLLSPPTYLQAIDKEIVACLEVMVKGRSYDTSLTGAAGYFALRKIIESGRAYLGRERRGPLAWDAARDLHAAWKKSDGLFRLDCETAGGGAILGVEPPCYLDPVGLCAGRLRLPDGFENTRLDWLRRAPVVDEVGAADLSRRLALLAPYLPAPVEVKYHDYDRPPQPCLTVTFDPQRPEEGGAELRFAYDTLTISADDPDIVCADSAGRLVRVHRHRDAENQAQARLVAAGLEPSPAAAWHFRMGESAARFGAREAWLSWFDTVVPELENAGWRIERQGAAAFEFSQADRIAGEIESAGSDWFSLRFDLEVDGRRLPLLPLVSQLLEHYRPGQLPDKLYLDNGQGHYVAIPAPQIEPVLKTIVELFDRVKDDALKLGRPDATRLLDLAGIPLAGGGAFKKLARRLADFSGLQPVPLPSTFKGELRQYQQHGVNWLQFLRLHELGGILADDMGLGKTIQALAHLAVEKRAGRMKHPCLIVAPTSLMGNWRREASSFTPGLQVLVLHGAGRTAHFPHLAEFDLVLTTYPLLPRDRAALLKQPWHYLILDEAQQIKNPRAQAAQVVRAMQAKHRLCLTGTPMENHLGELWAQFDFLMPGFLGDRDSFTRTYRTPIEKYHDGERLSALVRRTAPFLLRRTKDRVAVELPPKTEIVRAAVFEPRQARLYEAIRLTMEKKVREAVAARGLARSHIIMLEALLKLRQVCCDPRLLPPGTRGAHKIPSAKYELLFELLPELLAEGRRVLLFSQFATMLGLIESEIRRRGFDYCKLTGKTQKRDAMIQRFRDGQANLFLISLKAGGVGLNLVEADTVIHYDPWWNPAVEHQATDRAHRIGQDKPVFVYKLITEGTVEAKILALQQRKQKLAASVYGKGRGQDEAPIDAATIQGLLAAD